MPESELELWLEPVAELEVEVELGLELEAELGLALEPEVEAEPELELAEEAEAELALEPELVPELVFALEPEPVAFVLEGVSSDCALTVTVPSFATFTHSPDFAMTRFAFTPPELDLIRTISPFAYESCCRLKMTCPCSSDGFMSFVFTV